jgi:hypothetical protein
VTYDDDSASLALDLETIRNDLLVLTERQLSTQRTCDALLAEVRVLNLWLMKSAKHRFD